MFEWIISGLQTITVKDGLYGICTILPGIFALYIAYKSSKDQSELTNEILEKATRPYLYPSLCDIYDTSDETGIIYHHVIYRIENYGKSVAIIKSIKFDPPQDNGGVKHSVTEHSQNKSETQTIINHDKFIEIQSNRTFACNDSKLPIENLIVELTLTYMSSYKNYTESYKIDEITGEIFLIEPR